MFRLKFEIFIPSEPQDKFDALEQIRAALKNFECPEEFIQWRKEND